MMIWPSLTSSMIAEGRAPAGMTVTRLARKLPLAWAEQEMAFGLV
jgi:hypothetical protein